MFGVSGNAYIFGAALPICIREQGADIADDVVSIPPRHHGRGASAEMIYSFDIFDTVLTRKTFRPGDIHLLVAQDLIAEKLWADSVAEWRNSREEAERVARCAALAEESWLVDINVEVTA